MPVPDFGSLDELNAYLCRACLKYAQENKVPGLDVTVISLWEEEKKALLPLPSRPFACCRTVHVKSDRYARVCFETNYYFVPTIFADSLLILRAYVDRVEVWRGSDEMIARHTRGATAAGRNPRPLPLPAGAGQETAGLGECSSPEEG